MVRQPPALARQLLVLFALTCACKAGNCWCWCICVLHARLYGVARHHGALGILQTLEDSGSIWSMKSESGELSAAQLLGTPRLP